MRPEVGWIFSSLENFPVSSLLIARLHIKPRECNMSAYVALPAYGTSWVWWLEDYCLMFKHMKISVREVGEKNKIAHKKIVKQSAMRVRFLGITYLYVNLFDQFLIYIYENLDYFSNFKFLICLLFSCIFFSNQCW